MRGYADSLRVGQAEALDMHISDEIVERVQRDLLDVLDLLNRVAGYPPEFQVADTLPMDADEVVDKVVLAMLQYAQVRGVQGMRKSAIRAYYLRLSVERKRNLYGLFVGDLYSRTNIRGVSDPIQKRSLELDFATSVAKKLNVFERIENAVALQPQMNLSSVFRGIVPDELHHNVSIDGLAALTDVITNIARDGVDVKIANNPMEDVVEKLSALMSAKNLAILLSFVFVYLVIQHLRSKEQSWLPMVTIVGLFLSTKLPECATYVRHLITKDTGVLETQIDIGDMTIKSVMAILFYGIVPKELSRDSFEKFFKKASDMKKLHLGLMYSFDFAIEVAQQAVDWAAEMLNVERIKLKEDDWPECGHWLEETRSLINEHEQTLRLDWNLFNRVMILKRKGEALKMHAERRKELELHNRCLFEVLSKLEVLLGKLQRAGIVASGPKKEPLGIMIGGQPGVGKTTSSHNAMLSLVAAIVPEEDLDRFAANQNDFIYNRVSEEEFFTGYHGQTVFYFDDIGQVRDVPGVSNGPMMEAIRAINCNNWNMHMAALADKGTVSFSSDIVWATTNLRSFDDKCQSLWDPAAFERRWKGFWCAPIKEFTLDPDNYDPQSSRLDFSKVDTTDITYKHLRWWPWDLHSGRIILDQPMTYEEFIAYTVKTYEHRFGIGEQILANNTMVVVREVVRRKMKLNMLPQGDFEGLVQEEYAKRRSSCPASSKLPDKSIAWAPERKLVKVYLDNMYPELKECEREALTRSYSGTLSLRECDADKKWIETVGSEVDLHVKEMCLKPKIGSYFSEFKSTLTCAIDSLGEAGRRAIGLLDANKAKLAVVASTVGIVAIIHRFVSRKPHEVQSSQRKNVTKRAVRTYGRSTHHSRVAREFVGDVQLSIDKDCDQVLTKVFQRCMYRVSSDGYKNPFGYLTFVCDHIAVMPQHYWLKWQEIRDREGSLLLKLCRVGNTQTKEFEFDELRAYTSEENVDKDVIFVLFPEHMDRAPDIRKYFVSVDHLPKKKFDATLLLPKGNDVRWVVTSTYVNSYGVTYKEFVCPKILEYPIATEVGDCGAWVAQNNRNSGSAKLIGMHVAGTGCAGVSVVLSKEEVEEAVTEITKSANLKIIREDLHENIVYESSLSPQMQFTTLGMGAKIGTNLRTQVVPSCLSKLLPPTRMAPAYLRPFTIGGRDIDPWVLARSKYNLPSKYIHLPDLMLCTRSYLQMAMDNSDDCGTRLKYSFETAVAGIPGVPYCDGIPRSTSAGYPWCLNVPKGFNGKQHMFGRDGDYDFSSRHALEVRQSVEHIIAEAKQGRRTLVLYMDFLKDERRSLEKVAQGKTRLISGCPVDYLIAVRMYFMDFVRWYMANNVRNGSAVGVNVYSDDWRRVANYMCSDKEDRCVIAGDFKAYDGSLPRVVQLMFLAAVNEYYQNSDVSDSEYEEDCLVRKVLFEDVVNSKHLVDGFIYEWTSSMPSGNFLTTILNSFCNNVIIRYAALSEMCRAKGIGDSTLVRLETMQLLEREIRVLTYGDDNLVSVSEALDGLITQYSLAKSFSYFGFEYTDETKSDRGQELRLLSEVKFLKRGFSYQNDGSVLAPLEIEVIQEIPKWTKRKDANHEIEIDNVEVFLRELSLHTKKVWDTNVKAVLRAAREKLGFVPLVSDWATNRQIARESIAYI